MGKRLKLSSSSHKQTSEKRVGRYMSKSERLRTAVAKRRAEKAKKPRERLIERKKTKLALLRAEKRKILSHRKEKEKEEEDKQLLPDYMLEEKSSAIEKVPISQQDEAILANFGPQGGATLADLIMQKLENMNLNEEQNKKAVDAVDPKIVSVYKQVAKIMKNYSSGRLPKPFLAIPQMQRWQELLELTEPEEWSANATLAATKLFASKMTAAIVRKFYKHILLGAVLRDLANHPGAKLNFHLYEALKKSVFKPGAFLKGIVLPLAKGGCSSRQAFVIGSVISKVSLPVLHASAAILKLTELPYSLSSAFFLKILLSKHYSLPTPVIKGVAAYFGNFIQEEKQLPVLWYQTVILFLKSYGIHLDHQALDRIRAAVKQKHHHILSPTILIEIQKFH